MIAPSIPLARESGARATVRPWQAYTAVVSASRPVRLVLGLLLFAVFASMAGMAVIYLMVGRSPSLPQRATLTLRPSGDLPETAPEVVLPFSDSHSLSVRGYVEVIRKAKRDPRVARLLIRPGGLDSPFWAKVQELREAIVDFKPSGKPVYAFLEYGGDREYYLATAADKVFLLPQLDSGPDRGRELRGVPARHLRLDRHLSGLPARRRLTRPRSTRSPRRRSRRRTGR